MARKYSEIIMLPGQVSYYAGKLRSFCNSNPNFQIKQEHSTANGLFFLLKHGLSFRSNGETITVVLTSLGDSTNIEITSECAVPLQLVDWGKNADNVRDIINYLKRPDARYFQQPSPNYARQQQRQQNSFKSASQSSGPFIFVSYSHDDMDLIAPFISALQNSYNVWFDEGLDYRTEETWVEQIASQIEKCSIFLFAMTDNSLKSDYCKKELYYASKVKKPFINILFNENVQLPSWFDFGFGCYQICMYYRFSSPKYAIADLESKCNIFDKIKKC